MIPQQRIIYRNFPVPTRDPELAGAVWSVRPAEPPQDPPEPPGPRLPSLSGHTALFAGLLALLLAVLIVMLHRIRNKVAPADAERSEGAESSTGDSPQFV